MQLPTMSFAQLRKHASGLLMPKPSMTNRRLMFCSNNGSSTGKNNQGPTAWRLTQWTNQTLRTLSPTRALKNLPSAPQHIPITVPCSPDKLFTTRCRKLLPTTRTKRSTIIKPPSTTTCNSDDRHHAQNRQSRCLSHPYRWFAPQLPNHPSHTNRTGPTRA